MMLGSRGVGGNDDVHALADERQPHLDEHLLVVAGTDLERCRLGVGEALTRRQHDIAAGRDVRKRHLADVIARRLADYDVAIGAPERNPHRRDADALERYGDDHSSGAGGLSLWRLKR
jgi:hypothetical protein